MSIYSGFATRFQQQTYDQLVFHLVELLSTKILNSYHHHQTDEDRFSKIIKQIFMKLSLMEKQKYLNPNISNALYHIMEYYLKQTHETKLQTSSKKNTFWVKKQDKLEQSFSQDIHNNRQTRKYARQTQKSARKKFSNFQIHNKTPKINPEMAQIDKSERKISTIEVQLRNKINKPITNSISKQKQNRKKHQSMRRLQQDDCSSTQYHIQGSLPKGICSHCCRQTQLVKKKASSQQMKQKSDEKFKRSKSSRIQIPELVKQYIEKTNHNYMRHYQKRKLKFCSQLS